MRNIKLRNIGLNLALLSVLICLLILTFLAKQHAHFTIDLQVTRFLQSYNSSFLKDLMIFVSLPGDNFCKYLGLPGVTISLLIIRKNKEAAMLLFSALGAEFLSIFLKYIVGRARPSLDLISRILSPQTTTSFPSGHVLFYMGFFGFLLYLSLTHIEIKPLRRIFVFVCLFFLVLIGVSRIYLGLHWLSDTIGAYLAGFLWVIFSIRIYNLWKSKKT